MSLNSHSLSDYLLYDYAFIELYVDYLKKDDLCSLDSKNKKSTVLCTSVYIETINNCMIVYGCLIDPMEALHRVPRGKTFLYPN